jgi:hypothetical protein
MLEYPDHDLPMPDGPMYDDAKSEIPAPPSPVRRFLTIAFLAALYVLGLVHWEYFFDHGGIYFPSHDWPKEHKYYSVLRTALETRTLPLHTDQSEEFHGTQRFLGNPEVNWSPQILALPWMDTGRFIIWNVCVLYSAGFIGLLLLRRRYALGALPFTFLFLLCNFNGTPTSHMAVGHSMWCGHFLLPFFYLFLLELAEDGAPTRPALKLAATLFFIFLQGAFHYFVWCAMFLGLFILFNRRFLRPGLLALVAAGLLLTVRILPAAVAFWNDPHHVFLTGYPTLADTLLGFVSIRHHDYQGIGMVYWRIVGWCEYDIYLSPPGFALLVIFGIVMRFSKDPMFADCRFSAFDKPMATQAILSFSDFYAIIALLPIPLLNGERVSARFLIIPVMLLLILAAVRMQRMLERTPAPAKHLLFAGLAAAVAATAYCLYLHSVEWSTRDLASEPEALAKVKDLSVQMLTLADPIYTGTLVASALGTLLAWLAWVYYYRRPERIEAIYERAEMLAAKTPLLRLFVTRAPIKADVSQEDAANGATNIQSLHALPRYRDFL